MDSKNDGRSFEIVEKKKKDNLTLTYAASFHGISK